MSKILLTLLVSLFCLSTLSQEEIKLTHDARVYPYGENFFVAESKMVSLYDENFNLVWSQKKKSCGSYPRFVYSRTNAQFLYHCDVTATKINICRMSIADGANIQHSISKSEIKDEMERLTGERDNKLHVQSVFASQRDLFLIFRRDYFRKGRIMDHFLVKISSEDFSYQVVHLGVFGLEYGHYKYTWEIPAPFCELSAVESDYFVVSMKRIKSEGKIYSYLMDYECNFIDTIVMTVPEELRDSIPHGHRNDPIEQHYSDYRMDNVMPAAQGVLIWTEQSLGELYFYDSSFYFYAGLPYTGAIRFALLKFNMDGTRVYYNEGHDILPDLGNGDKKTGVIVENIFLIDDEIHFVLGVEGLKCYVDYTVNADGKLLLNPERPAIRRKALMRPHVDYEYEPNYMYPYLQANANFLNKNIDDPKTFDFYSNSKYVFLKEGKTIYRYARE